MSHEDSQNIDSDDSDRLVIEDDEIEDERPMLESLLIKKGPNGYTVEKGRKNEFLNLNMKPKPTNKPTFYMVPVSKSQPLTSEELSEIYVKYVEQSPYFANTFAIANAFSQQNAQQNPKVYENTYQDPVVDSTNPDDEELPEPLQETLSPKKTDSFSLSSEIEDASVLTEDDSAFMSSDQNSFAINSTNSSPNLDWRFKSNDFLSPELRTLTPACSLEVSKQLFTPEEDYNSGIEFEFIKLENFEERQDSQLLDPIILARSLSGGYYIKKDCFIGGKRENNSGLEGFQPNSNSQVKMTYGDIYFKEPLLERLFSNVSEASQATTETIASSDDMEYETDIEKDQDNSENKSSNKNVADDGYLPVINRADSDIIIVGYD